MKILVFTILLYFFSILNFAFSDVIEDVEVKNNKRITKQTIITYGEIELNKDYDLNAINQVFKNLYDTDFFETIKISIENNKLIIDVKENKKSKMSISKE